MKITKENLLLYAVTDRREKKMGRTNLGATCCLPLAFPLCGSFAVAWIVGGRQGLDNLFFSFASPRAGAASAC